MKPTRRGMPLVVLACLAGCAPAMHRNPVPASLAYEAQVPGHEHVRFVGTDIEINREGQVARMAELREHMRDSGLLRKPLRMLAISGGGAEGAYGAGLICGWTDAGDRPEFAFVTGISTGALIAPFAFLGPDYDDELKAVYTTMATKDLIRKRGLLAAVTGDSMADTAPLAAMIAKHFDDDMIAAIAREYRRGRRLYVGTTNLDLVQPVLWNIGGIAAGGDPDLVRALLLASASIPVAFPPVYIDVEAGGQPYDEMHVDGGAVAQVFVYPLSFDMDGELRKVGASTDDMRMYVIRNARLEPIHKVVDPKLFPIIERSTMALLHSQGVGNLYQIYLGAQRDGIDFNLAYIPADFDLTPDEPFDKNLMNALFDRGYEAARSGYPWQKKPPDFYLP